MNKKRSQKEVKAKREKVIARVLDIDPSGRSVFKFDKAAESSDQPFEVWAAASTLSDGSELKHEMDPDRITGEQVKRGSAERGRERTAKANERWEACLREAELIKARPGHSQWGYLTYGRELAVKFGYSPRYIVRRLKKSGFVPSKCELGGRET